MSTEIGVWGWGLAAAILGVVAICLIAKGGSDTLNRIEKGGNVLGAIIGATILAWAYFYQHASDKEKDKKIDDLTAAVSKLTEEVRKNTSLAQKADPK